MRLLAHGLLVLTALGEIYWLLALVAVRRHFRRRAPPAPRPLPAASLLKPVRGLDADARECLESFFRLDYPAFEIVFAVSDPGDPVLPLLAELRAAHPEVPSRLVVAPAPGPNRKACLLEAAARAARHDVLVATDGDMRVDPAWLREVVAALEVPGVGLVTCPYRGASPRSLPAQLEALHMGATFLPSAVVASRCLGVPFAMGSTMALRRGDLADVGGFATLADYLADDYQLGARVAALGRRVVLSSHLVDTLLGRTGFREGWDREVRWGRCALASQPLGHVLYAITFSTPLAVLALLACRLAPVGWVALAGALALRWAVAAGVARATGDRATLRALPLLPLRDALSAAVWAASLASRRVVWRGETFEVDGDGRLRPAAEPAATAAPPAR